MQLTFPAGILFILLVVSGTVIGAQFLVETEQKAEAIQEEETRLLEKHNQEIQFNEVRYNSSSRVVTIILNNTGTTTVGEVNNTLSFTVNGELSQPQAVRILEQDKQQLVNRNPSIAHPNESIFVCFVDSNTPQNVRFSTSVENTRDFSGPVTSGDCPFVNPEQ